MNLTMSTPITRRSSARPDVSLARFTLTGASLGLAWGAGLRGWMAVLSGGISSFSWSGTFMGILLPALLVGAALAWAEYVRRLGGRGAWRWTAVAPLLFIVMPALVQDGFVPTLLSTGLGSGAIAVALIGMLGGYAISGRGPRWARLLSRATVAALLVALIVAALTVAPAQGQPATTAQGAYMLLTFVVFCGLLAWACAIPHRPTKQQSASQH